MFDNTDDLLAMVQAALGETDNADAVSVGADGMIEGTFTDLSAEAPAPVADEPAAEAPAADADGVDDALLAALSAEMGGVEDSGEYGQESDGLLAALDGLLGGDSTPADEGNNSGGDVGGDADGAADDLLAQMRGLLGE